MRSERSLARNAPSRRRAPDESQRRQRVDAPEDRSLATVGHHCSSWATRESRSAIALWRAVSPVDRGDQVSEHQLRGWLLELLTGEPAPVSDRPGRGLGIDPAMTQQHLRDPVAGVIRSRRHASWARISSRAASTSTGGTTTLVNEPASSSLASSSASLRSVLTRSDGPLVSCPGRSPPRSARPRPRHDRARTQSAPPHSKPSQGHANPQATRRVLRCPARTSHHQLTR